MSQNLSSAAVVIGTLRVTADYLDVAVITVVPCSGLLIMFTSQLYGLQFGLRVRALVLPHHFAQTVIILF